MDKQGSDQTTTIVHGLCMYITGETRYACTLSVFLNQRFLMFFDKLSFSNPFFNIHFYCDTSPLFGQYDINVIFCKRTIYKKNDNYFK